MSIFDLLTLFGGLAMFLYGMRLMGNGLKESSSGTLKAVMEKVTDNPVKAFLLGVGVTALIQSSTATIVITSGLVGAGILSLHQSLGILVGANVGTTVTGQIIRLLDMDASAGSWLQIFKPSSLAPIALIIGIVVIMGGRFKSSKSVGDIAMGFGILFSGLLSMTSAVSALSESPLFERLLSGLGENAVIGYITGAAVAFMLQSSSATIGILQAFSTTGLLTFSSIYSVIVGVYLGDCVTTAIVCSIGAKADAKRVGVINIVFNLCKSLLILVGVTIVHKLGLLDGLWNATANSGIIANTNTIFNLCCAVILLPMLSIFENISRRIVKDDPVPENPYKEKLEALNPVFFNTPALALNSCYDLLLTQYQAAMNNIKKAYSLLADFDEKKREEILLEEDNIDLLTDRISRYIVEMMPHLTQAYHTGILDQYYKVVTEFERLGDLAVFISDKAADLYMRGVSFSDTAFKELDVLHSLLVRIMDLAQLAFENRDVTAAYHIEPLEEAADDIVSKLKVNHLNRMSRGECDVYADANYVNLLSDMKRIASICSNIGEATVIRANPELAEQQHDYVSKLRHNEQFNAEYEEARDKYLSELKIISGPNPAQISANTLNTNALV